MKERPILFSGPMVRALLDGRKTQTRRVVKVQTGDLFDVRSCVAAVQEYIPAVDPIAGVVGRTSRVIRCPYGVPGDVLWVRETWSFIGEQGIFELYQANPNTCRPIYRADGATADRWWPSIHMPRWASRISLRITDVRVERLNDISEADARAEGFPIGGSNEPYDVPPIGSTTAWNNYGRASFCLYWSQLNGPGSWDANPWVWAVSFEVVK